MTALAQAGVRGRAVLKEYKRQVKDGETSIRQVLALKPEPLRNLSVAELVRLLPWIGTERMARFGDRAAAHGINLLVTVEHCSIATAMWVVNALDTIDEDERQPITVEGRLKERLQRVEMERDLALQKLEEAEKALRGRQLVMPVCESERKADRLIEAIQTHRRTITDPRSSGEAWANAETALWAVLDEVAGDG